MKGFDKLIALKEIICDNIDINKYLEDNIDLDVKSINDLPKTENISGQGEKIKVMSSVNKYHSDVKYTSYYKSRGISDDIVNKYMLGYDRGNNAAVIPYYENGNPVAIEKIPLETSDQESNFEDGNRYFNADLLNSDQNLIFVTTSIFEALSVEEIINEPAIAIRGFQNINSFLSNIESSEVNKHFILLSDDFQFDKETQNTIANNSSCSIYNLTEYENANLYLANEEQNVLKDELLSARDKILDHDFSISYLDELRDDILTTESSFIPSGFNNLDDILLGGLLPGIYTIGAISSLGKTTFTLQMSDQIASKGKDVIYFSLEQSPQELMCKSITRKAYQIDRYSTLNTFDMVSNNLDKEQDQLFNKAIKEYRKTAKHLAIIRKARTVKDIRNKVEEKIRLRGQKPVVIIDFLQRLEFPKSSMSYREAIDFNLSYLKELSDDYNLTLIIISSFNRDNYNNEVRLQSFKESGGIEYTADVVIGLQFTKIHEHNKFTQKDIGKWKAENPRKIQAVILKYRNGPIGGRANFKYYPEYNNFKEI